MVGILGGVYASLVGILGWYMPPWWVCRVYSLPGGYVGVYSLPGGYGRYTPPWVCTLLYTPGYTTIPLPHSAVLYTRRLGCGVADDEALGSALRIVMDLRRREGSQVPKV